MYGFMTLQSLLAISSAVITSTSVKKVYKRKFGVPMICDNIIINRYSYYFNKTNNQSKHLFKTYVRLFLLLNADFKK